MAAARAAKISIPNAIRPPVSRPVHRFGPCHVEARSGSGNCARRPSHCCRIARYFGLQRMRARPPSACRPRGLEWRSRHQARPLMNRKRPEELRSHRWFGVNDLRSFGHRSRLKQIGLATDDCERQAGHRHHQHLERAQRLPRPFPHPRRGGQARRAAGRRLPGRTAGDVAGGAVREADDHALSQLPGDGGGGIAALAIPSTAPC